MIDGWLLGLGFAFCVVLLALTSAAHAAFVQVNAVRLRLLMQRGMARAVAVSEVRQYPGGLSAAIWILYLTAVAWAAGLTVFTVLRYDLPPHSALALFV